MSADSDPAIDAVVVVLDTVISPANIRGLYVGGSGDVEVVTSKGNTRVFKSAQAGSVIPIRVKQVLSANTTATDILALY